MSTDCNTLFNNINEENLLNYIVIVYYFLLLLL